MAKRKRFSRGTPLRLVEDPVQGELWEPDPSERLAPAGTASGVLDPELDDVLQLTVDLRGLDPIEVDGLASAIAASLQLVLLDDEIGEVASRAVAERANAGDQVYVNALHSLRHYGGSMQAWATRLLADLAYRPAPELDVVGTARVEAARRISVLQGDIIEIVLELSYPGSDSTPVCVLTLDTMQASMAVGVDLASSVDEFIEESKGDAGIDSVEDRPVTEALGEMSHALWMFDHTLGAEQVIQDDDVLTLRPLLDHLLASRSHAEFEFPLVSDERREDLVADFVTWVGEAQPERADYAAEMAPVMVDFAVDRGGGDPLRWSAGVAGYFLEFAAKRIAAEPALLGDLPELTRLMITWSHRRNGWPEEATRDAMGTVDQVLPMFEAELGSPSSGLVDTELLAGLVESLGTDEADLAQVVSLYNRITGDGPAVELDALEPPVGGSHPEPFDDSGIDSTLIDRARSIAEAAATNAGPMFDDEFVTLVNRFTADVARHPATAFTRGRLDIWASAVVYAVAQCNDIPGGRNPLSRPASEITDNLAGAATTIKNKARELRDLLDLNPYAPPVRFRHSRSELDPFDVELDDLGPFRFGQATPSFGPIDPVDPAVIDGDFFVLRASLDGVKPKIWREVRLPIDATFAQFHQLLQLSFGWYNYHLHSFELRGASIGPGPDDMDVDFDYDEADLRLCDVLTPGDELLYLYDFGDGWAHSIEVKGVQHEGDRSDLPSFGLLGGARACPPEDCGGPWGYGELLAAKKDRHHPRHAELAEWLPIGFNPKHFDAHTTNTYLATQTW